MTDDLGLGEVYGAALSRVEAGRRESKAWNDCFDVGFSCGASPTVKANELWQALAIEIGSPDLNTDNVPSIGTLLACCQ